MAFEHDREEWARDVAVMDEMERVETCGHYWRKGACIYCGEVADA